MQENIDVLRKQFLLKDEDFEDYYNKVLQVVIDGKQKTENKRLVIVGGQTGAGKSRLIPVVERELNENAIVVDFDILRAYHPNFQIVSNEHIEKTHIILHPDVEKVKNKIMKFLRENDYDVIYEGSLRNTQGFIDFSKDFIEKGYNVSMYIMAVAELESFGSTYTRYAEDLEKNNNPRWVEKVAHDESYTGVLKTVNEFQTQDLCSNVKVFTRGNTEPKEIYSTEGRQFHTAIEAIQYGREIGKNKAVEDFWEKYKKVYEIFRKYKPELLDTLKEWEILFKKEYTQYKKNELDKQK